MKNKIQGFTLIEILIAVVMVAILAAIALPSYRDQTQKARRADGKALLTNMSQQLERCYTKFGAYNNANCSVVNGTTQTSEDGFYTVTPAGITATTYTLTAVPQGVQASDATCGSLSLTQAGVQTYTGSGTQSECW